MLKKEQLFLRKSGIFQNLKLIIIETSHAQFVKFDFFSLPIPLSSTKHQVLVLAP